MNIESSEQICNAKHRMDILCKRMASFQDQMDGETDSIVLQVLKASIYSVLVNYRVCSLVKMISRV